MDSEARVSIEKTGYTAVGRDDYVCRSSHMLSTPIPLEHIVNGETILRKLQDLGVTDTSHLWVLIALDNVLNQSIGVAALKQLARNLGSQCSPFKPEYRVDHKYSISVGSELSTDSFNCRNLADSGVCKATFSAEIGLPTGIIRSSATLSLLTEEFLNMQDGIADLLRELTLSLVECQYETLPATLDRNSLTTPVKIRLVTEILENLKKPTKGHLDSRLTEIIIRRYGLLSGRIETLEEVAKDLDSTRDLTRERVRQLEEKAFKLILHPKRLGTEPFSSFQGFKEQIRLWLSKKNQVAHALEVIDHFNNYIDFDKYEPISSMFFLCSIAGLSVKQVNRDGGTWLVSTSEIEYERFVTAYKALVNSNMDEAGVTTNTLLKHIEEVRTIISFADLESIDAVRSLANQVIGPSRIMTYREFISSLRRRCTLDRKLTELLGHMVLWDMGSNCDDHRLICSLAGVSVIPAAEYERILFGEWVSCGLTKHAQDVVQAIIYSGANEGLPDCQIEPVLRLKQGISAEQIVTYLANRIGYEISEQALGEICRRNPDVFIQPGLRSWGLIGAGARTNGKKGNQADIGYRIADCMVDILHNSPDGLPLGELVREVRRIVPSAAEQTVRLYLTTLHPERFESTRGDRFKIRQKYIDSLEERVNQEPTIDIVTRVLREAEAPLSTNEIIRRCEKVQFVSHAAVRGYLSQNYDGRFRRLDNGKYVAA